MYREIDFVSIINFQTLPISLLLKGKNYLYIKSTIQTFMCDPDRQYYEKNNFALDNYFMTI